MSTLTRPEITGTRHGVSSGHYLATTAAHDILAAGGNAVDAGVAAAIMLGVVQPDLVNVAGVAPIMIRMAGMDVPITIDGLGVWPASIPPDHFMTRHGGTIPDGVERIVVPAAPAAWLDALARFGTMSFRDVAGAAARHARDGFAVHPLLVDTITEHADGYRAFPSSAEVYLPHGRLPRVGERFVQTDLATTFERLFAAERAAPGTREAGLQAVHDAFYRGDLAAEIVDFVQAEGGFLTREDMAGYRCRTEPALETAALGGRLFVCGAWCQGPVLAMALRQLEAAGLAGLAHNSADYIHLLVEVLDNVFADREYHFGDPAVVDVPLDRLMSDAHARARLAQIDPRHARGAMPGRLLPGGGPEASVPAGDDDPRPEPDTSYVAVIDAAGNAFSATPSDGSWSVPVVPGTGLVPSSRGSQSRPDPRHPSGVAPGKRPRLTPNPAMFLHDGGVMPFGTPGGDVQSQAMLQFLLNRVHFGMGLQQAIEAPRFATYNYPGSFAPFTHHHGLVKLEPGIADTTAAALADRGHAMSRWPDNDWRAGGLCAVQSVAAEGLILCGADPRRPSHAIAS
ncbi:gamma-glutamyltransferase family protein [Rhodobaculum claviforme]|uniref:Gamma-glutamyltransferase n=1 Tax=Rhodobaculum claviforme TaxID=1549854 RepID=A0A934TM81_9RHOB|nr:gamma-glutamyltransferase [Rhodobaculum claviforme]MBK5928101.1 gamma-glutamyltransferase [Rhodobaculum claviforme]